MKFLSKDSLVLKVDKLKKEKKGGWKIENFDVFERSEISVWCVCNFSYAFEYLHRDVLWRSWWFQRSSTTVLQFPREYRTRCIILECHTRIVYSASFFQPNHLYRRNVDEVASFVLCVITHGDALCHKGRLLTSHRKGSATWMVQAEGSTLLAWRTAIYSGYPWIYSLGQTS